MYIYNVQRIYCTMKKKIIKKKPNVDSRTNRPNVLSMHSRRNNLRFVLRSRTTAFSPCRRDVISVFQMHRPCGATEIIDQRRKTSPVLLNWVQKVCCTIQLHKKIIQSILSRLQDILSFCLQGTNSLNVGFVSYLWCKL